VNENENISNKKRKREALREHFEQLKKKKLEIDKKLEKKEQLRIKKKEKKKKEKQKKLILKYETGNSNKL